MVLKSNSKEKINALNSIEMDRTTEKMHWADQIMKRVGTRALQRVRVRV